jgi:hypothetical protein
MENNVHADEYLDGAFSDWDEKTAGDNVQSFWCRLHLETMGDCFQLNVIQAAISRWLNPTHAMLPN